MNRCIWEKQVLLDEAGELNAEEKNALTGHLATCAACRAFQAEYRALAEDCAASAIPAMPDRVRRAILAEAESCRTARKAVRLLHLPLNPVPLLTSIAALLLFCLAGLHVYRHLHRPSDALLADQPNPETTEILDAILTEDAWEEECLELELSFALVSRNWQQTDSAWIMDEETEILANSLQNMEKSS